MSNPIAAIFPGMLGQAPALITEVKAPIVVTPLPDLPQIKVAGATPLPNLLKVVDIKPLEAKPADIKPQEAPLKISAPILLRDTSLDSYWSRLCRRVVERDIDILVPKDLYGRPNSFLRPDSKKRFIDEACDDAILQY